MKIDHPSEELLDGYRKRVLNPDVFLAVHKHVEACSACQEKGLSFAESERDYEKLYSALMVEPEAKPYHLSYDEIEAYVNATMDEVDSETAETHLEVCADCKTDLERLRDIKESLAPGRGSRSTDLLESHGTTTGSSGQRPVRRDSVRVAYWIAAAALVIVAMIVFQAITSRKTHQITNTNQGQTPPLQDDHNQPDGEDTKDRAPEAPRTAYVLIDGTRHVMIDEHGVVDGIGELPGRLEQAVRSALRKQELDRPSVLAELREEPATLSGPDNGVGFQVLRPIGMIVETNRPTFRWTELDGAANYTVTVTDTRLNQIETSPPLNVPHWTITKPLEYGAIYTWQVTALKDGKLVRSPVPPEPQAKFKVLDRATLEELKAVRRTQPRSHLALGVLYAEAGLLDEAEQEFRTLAKANPKIDVVRNLLRSVQSFKRK
jgi:hypothetical protein